MMKLEQPLKLLLCAVNSGDWVYGQIPAPSVGMLRRLRRGFAAGRGEVWEDSPYWYEVHNQWEDTIGLSVRHDHTTIALCAAGTSTTVYPRAAWGILCCSAYLQSSRWPAHLDKETNSPWFALETYQEPIQVDGVAVCRLQEFIFALPYALARHLQLQAKP